MRNTRCAGSVFVGAVILMGAAACLGVNSSAHAVPITYSASSGVLAAEATFDVSGSNLIITLTNTSTHDVLLPDHVLTCVFFNIAGPLMTLTPGSGSVTLNAGSTVLFGSAPGGVVGGEFSFLSGISNQAPNNANYGISSAGLNIFGQANFPGANLHGPTGVNGLEYGITSAGDNPLTGNSPVIGSQPLIQNSIVIVLPGLPVGFNPAAMISNVSFQYGTSLSEPTLPGEVVPGPATLMLLAMACAISSRRVRRR